MENLHCGPSWGGLRAEIPSPRRVVVLCMHVENIVSKVEHGQKVNTFTQFWHMGQNTVLIQKNGISHQ